MVEVRQFPYEGRARVIEYYDLLDSDIFECACGWCGTFDACVNGYFDGLTDATCRDCDRMLAIRSHPTPDHTRRAAAAGDVRAIGDLPAVDQFKEGQR